MHTLASQGFTAPIGGMVLLRKIVLETTQTEIRIDSIPSGYTALRLLAFMNGNGSSSYESVDGFINDDYTLANYIGAYRFGANGSGGGQLTHPILGCCNDSFTGSLEVGPLDIIYPYYSVPNMRKAWCGYSWNYRPIQNNYFTFGMAGRWTGTDPIQTLTLRPELDDGTSNAWAPKTRVSLYGII